MELLVIIGIAVLVAVVVGYRRLTGRRPDEPESPDNDGR